MAVDDELGEQYLAGRADERARIRREQAAVIAEMRRHDVARHRPDWTDRLEEATRDA